MCESMLAFTTNFMIAFYKETQMKTFAVTFIKNNQNKYVSFRKIRHTNNAQVLIFLLAITWKLNNNNNSKTK